MVLIRSKANQWGKIKPVIFQSDDWGYCGLVPDKETHEQMKPIFSKRYGKREYFLGGSTLERPEDIVRLFSILEQFYDIDGRSPAFQAAYIMANPDCLKMFKNDCREYIDVELPAVPSLWQRGDFIVQAKKGIKLGVWVPIFHGVSHFNIDNWLSLISIKGASRDAAAMGCVLGEGTHADFEFNTTGTIKEVVKRLKRGLEIFNEVFGFQTDTAVLPAYVWPLRLEAELVGLGIHILEGKNLHTHTPSLIEKIRAKVLNVCGYKDTAKAWQITCGDYRPDLNLHYLERNVYFEPLQQGAGCNFNVEDVVNLAISQIETAWARNQPAVVTTHRFNYVQIEGKKSAWACECLYSLLNQLTAKHSDLHFFSDHDLLNCNSHES